MVKNTEDVLERIWKGRMMKVYFFQTMFHFLEPAGSRPLRGTYGRTGYLGVPTHRALSISRGFMGLGAFPNLDMASARCCLREITDL